jgi:hypothetical protein
MKRKVEILGDKSGLEAFSKILKDEDLSIVPEGERFILESESLNVLSDDDEFKGGVTELLNSVNAVALLFLGYQEKFTYQISQVNEDGTELLPIKSEVKGCGIAFANISGGTETSNPIRNWIKIAEKDEKLKEIFIYVNSNFYSWYELYKIYENLKPDRLAQEIMKSDKYKKKMNDGKTRTGDYIFSQNANYHRHHKDEKYKLTDPPMTLQEAQLFIRNVLCEWFKQKEQEWLNQKE